MSRFGTFKIQGVSYDMDDLTLNEVEEIEELGGTTFAELNFGSAKVMKAVAFVLMKRTTPELAIADVGRVKVIDFLPPDEDMPETSPPGEGVETESQNGSAPAAAGVPDSPASIAG
jgi:hypothetical protein